MTEDQIKRIARLAWEKLPAPAQPATPLAVATAVARATFESRGNHSEVHLSESDLFAVALIAADMQKKELR